jgi:hypothetical protein
MSHQGIKNNQITIQISDPLVPALLHHQYFAQTIGRI